MNTMQGSQLCRLCLWSGETLADIFDENGKLSFVEGFIQDLLQFQAVKDLRIPWLICPTCLGKLNEFRRFKIQCVECKIKFENRFMRDDFEFHDDMVIKQEAEEENVEIDESVDVNSYDEENIKEELPDLDDVDIKPSSSSLQPQFQDAASLVAEEPQNIPEYTRAEIEDPRSQDDQSDENSFNYGLRATDDENAAIQRLGDANITRDSPPPVIQLSSPVDQGTSSSDRSDISISAVPLDSKSAHISQSVSVCNKNFASSSVRTGTNLNLGKAKFEGANIQVVPPAGGSVPAYIYVDSGNGISEPLSAEPISGIPLTGPRVLSVGAPFLGSPIVKTIPCKLVKVSVVNKESAPQGLNSKGVSLVKGLIEKAMIIRSSGQNIAPKPSPVEKRPEQSTSDDLTDGNWSDHWGSTSEDGSEFDLAVQQKIGGGGVKGKDGNPMKKKRGRPPRQKAGDRDLPSADCGEISQDGIQGSCSSKKRSQSFRCIRQPSSGKSSGQSESEDTPSGKKHGNSKALACMHDGMTCDEVIELKRKRNAESSRVYYLSLTEEQKKAKLKRQAECKRLRRARLNEEQKKVKLEKEAEYRRRWLASLTEEELKDFRSRTYKYQCNYRAKRTPEQIEKERKRLRERYHIRKGRLSEEDLEAERRRRNEKMKLWYASLSDEERKAMYSRQYQRKLHRRAQLNQQLQEQAEEEEQE